MLVIAALSASRLYQGWARDYYWPPTGLASAPSAERDRVEIYLDDSLIGRGVDESGYSVRLNNRDIVVRKNVGFIAFCCGLGVGLLVAGLLARPKVEEPAQEA